MCTSTLPAIDVNTSAPEVTFQNPSRYYSLSGSSPTKKTFSGSLLRKTGVRHLFNSLSWPSLWKSLVGIKASVNGSSLWMIVSS